jgi:hypothetical protein
MAELPSGVIYAAGSTTFTGPDGVALYRAIALAAALKLAGKGIQMSRKVPRSQLLTAAGKLCGKSYKRGAYALAEADVRQWAEAMKAAIPVTVDEGEAP